MADAQTQTSEHHTGRMVGRIIFRACLVVVILLACLSILSYDPQDTHVLQGGYGPTASIHNWIGRFGAWFAASAFSTIGMAVFPALAILFVCIGARVYGQGVKKIRFSYFAGIALFTWGCSMFIGIFPDLLPELANRLNLSQTPGGVVGQRFCAPSSDLYQGGWMSFIVNPTGSIIITSSMMLLGLMTLWYYDWQEHSRNALEWVQDLWVTHRETPYRPSPIMDYEPDLEPEPEAAPEPEPKAAVLKKAAAVPEKKKAVAIAGDEKPAAGILENPYANYRLPSIKLLNELPPRTSLYDTREVNAKKQVLQQTLESFGIDASVGEATCGPRVTLFEIKPAPGVKVEKISSLANNISMNLKAESLRILTPIPGRDSVGIEVPNNKELQVHFREILNSNAWREAKGALPICLGKNIEGSPEILDLARAPHLLIAGATGSGKSVCINTLIMSLLYRFRPDELKLIMVDPKVVEFAGYAKLPHLVTPVINDVKKVPLALYWAIKQMEWRYNILSKAGVRNIASYNSRKPDPEPVLDDDGKPLPEKLPYVVIILDELADIMMTAKQEVETLLARIAQMARAVGIHAVIATQRPSVNIITGVIKANFPTRIAFQVTSITDSRTIIDGKGAESLLGRGDMLFKSPSGAKLARTQGCLVNDDEIERVVDFISAQAEPQFIADIFKTDGSSSSSSDSSAGDLDSDSFPDEEEDLLQQALKIILRDRRATTSYIQRSLRIGYNKASIIIEELERRGIVGPQIGSAPRDILIGSDRDDEDDADMDEDMDRDNDEDNDDDNDR